MDHLRPNFFEGLCLNDPWCNAGAKSCKESVNDHKTRPLPSHVAGNPYHCGSLREASCETGQENKFVTHYCDETDGSLVISGLYVSHYSHPICSGQSF